MFSKKLFTPGLPTQPSTQYNQFNRNHQNTTTISNTDSTNMFLVLGQRKVLLESPPQQSLAMRYYIVLL
jgi:hypothetical protein